MKERKMSEETKEKIRQSRIGKKHSDETIKKLKESHKGSRPWMLGFKHSQESINKMKDSHKGQNKGMRPKNLNELMEKGKSTRFQKGNKINIGNKHFLGRKHSQETINKISQTKKGHIVTEETRKILSEKGKGRPAWNKDICGEESTSWKGGLSFEPYTSDFSRKFKKTIKIRDAYMCQKCNMFEEDSRKIFGHSLHVHHVDYNKKLSIKENCITLCPRCHGETTENREAWKSFYQIMLSNKYKYQYDNKEIVIDFNKENNE